MKNLIFSFTLILFFSLKSFGQKTVIVEVPKRDFEKDKITLGHVSGHWVASFENRTYDLTIKSSTLKMLEQTFPIVIGSLEVKEGDKTIYSKEMNESNTIESFLIGSADDNQDKVHCTIHDDSINKSGKVQLSLNKKRTQLFWEMSTWREWASQPQLFDFPVNLTFNKH